jgi:hypothetical protein
MENQVVVSTPRTQVDSDLEVAGVTGAACPCSTTSNPTTLVNTLVSVPTPVNDLTTIQAHTIERLQSRLYHDTNDRCFHMSMIVTITFIIGMGLGAILTWILM